ncbi:pyrrolysine--tRNA(Pyl) ligase small subunit [Desulfospira joergensenii]|uniref:pyrrolysine--tRNA(Pyl) ligase small subunit n=1 Tax=Desulfospira joergensenii TaxID=53329 RepID=UPI0003B572B7|nr:pyrrolysine--tRNA(Pyl) ligase small subunit [Desulfospira joergensenii]
MDEKKKAPVKKRFYRKRVRLFNLIDKIKLWPSRTGQLHGIRSIDIMGETARLTTHCNKEFMIANSMNSRAGRWLRNKWFVSVCPACGVPDWKLEKYSSTIFKRNQGSMLIKDHTKETHIKETNDKKDPLAGPKAGEGKGS